MTLQIKKATKRQAKLRMSLVGPSGAGKTFTALSVAKNLGTRVLVVDTENASASKYSDIFEFDVIELDSFAPANFIKAIEMAAANGYDVLVIDSLSHAWMGRDGVLEMHDRAQARQKTQNSYTAWKDVTPEHNRLIEAIVGARVHLIATMRSKTEHVISKDEKSGRTTVEKVGLAAVQRDGMEYEFDVVGELRHEENTLVITKTRCSQLAGGVFKRAGRDVAEILSAWLDGAPPVEEAANQAPAPQPAAQTSPVRKSQEALENDRLMKEIEDSLAAIGREEAAFNAWFQKEYQSAMDWKQSSIAVKTELVEKIRGWRKKAA